jgi:hypothetical protein
LLSISIDSGRVERLGSVPEILGLLIPVHDDRAIYIMQHPTHELIRWEIGTQQATTLDRSPGLIFSPGNPSPDGRWIARQEMGTGNVEIRPMAGGDWKPLGKIDASDQITFTPDGNWLVYHGVDAAGKQALFRVATAGGQPERLGDFPSANRKGHLRISPDGRKIIADAQNAPEVWLLENFEPKQQAAR